MIASIIILGDPVKQTVMRRFKPGNVEESGSKWIVASSVTDRAERLLAEENLEFVALSPETTTENTTTQLADFDTD